MPTGSTKIATKSSSGLARPAWATSLTRVAFSVRDTGNGIPASALDTLYNPFRRTPSDDRFAFSSTGLGLALVHYVITDVHNAKIEVESTINQGTCFRITLPLGHRDHARKKREDVLATV